jgi:hypothetical protein
MFRYGTCGCADLKRTKSVLRACIEQSVNEKDIDRLYGLDPVIEVGAGEGSDALEQFVEATCPYCSEPILLHLDVAAGSQSYVEDCQVCCQPMMVSVEVRDGVLQNLNVESG